MCPAASSLISEDRRAGRTRRDSAPSSVVADPGCGRLNRVATAKAERLLNLVIALVNSPRFRTASWIRERVAGYGEAPTEDAFFRTFERDKTELRDLGIPLQTPADGSDGYRIPPGEFTLPQLHFTPAELAALGLAGRLWETTALGSAGTGAVRKLVDAAGAQESQRSAIGLLQPRVRTGDPAFAPLLAAVQARRAVTFDYRKSPGDIPRTRSVQPWGLVSYRGRWYLVGYDTERGDRRTFRLSRIAGNVKAVGRAGAVQIPPELDLLALVAGSAEQPADRAATLLVRPGRADGLRRSATGVRPERETQDLPPGSWDRVDLRMGHLWETARQVAANGPDVIVLDPPDLRAAVIRLLTETLDAATEGAGHG